ncbi:MAG: hypothetical protein CMA37_04375 [Euryarchaeota archaeon]|nr:hypothetical protein [Euryarchaeota archaeon]
MTNSEYQIELSSEGDVIDDESSSLESIFWVVWIIVPIFAVVACVILLRKKPNSQSMSSGQHSHTINTAQVQSNVIPCFSCRQPITSMMQGCPSCGARYHTTCRVETCLNCGVSSSTFVNVE